MGIGLTPDQELIAVARAVCEVVDALAPELDGQGIRYARFLVETADHRYNPQAAPPSRPSEASGPKLWPVPTYTYSHGAVPGHDRGTSLAPFQRPRKAK
jgi:hypothetical protein